MPFNSRLGIWSGDMNTLHLNAGSGTSTWLVTQGAKNQPPGVIFGGILLNVSRYESGVDLKVAFQIFASGDYGNENIYYRIIKKQSSSDIEVIGDWKVIS